MVGHFDDGDRNQIDGYGKCIVIVDELLPSTTGAYIAVYQRFYITPDGEELSPRRRRRMCRLPSLKGLISRRGLTKVQAGEG